MKKTCKLRGGRHDGGSNAEGAERGSLYDLAEVFKVFGDSTRIRILYRLFSGEYGVNELAESLNLTQSAVSHQLKLLKQARLVRARREGKSMIYALADEHVRTMMGQGLEHISE